MVHFVKGDQQACVHGCSVLVVVGRVVGEPVPLGLAWKGGRGFFRGGAGGHLPPLGTFVPPLGNWSSKKIIMLKLHQMQSWNTNNKKFPRGITRNLFQYL